MRRAYIAFGANLSNPRETFLNVISALGEAGLIIEAVSSLWHSPAWPPGSDAPDYRNAVLRILTDREAVDLMRLLLAIEAKLGRVRTVPNAPRSCDLDLIDYAGQISNAEACLLPHPRMQDRDFVLKPMAEVAPPDWRHPMSRKTISQLLEALA